MKSGAAVAVEAEEASAAAAVVAVVTEVAEVRPQTRVFVRDLHPPCMHQPVSGKRSQQQT